MTIKGEFASVEEVIVAIVADLREEADRANDKSMRSAPPGGNEFTYRAERARHQDLRRLANRYEEWLGLKAGVR